MKRMVGEGHSPLQTAAFRAICQRKFIYEASPDQVPKYKGEV